ncbi:MAG: DUF2336 domain-containing protein [Alphaproteobacteria bacterium]|nr:DUF2336 domain-containing protein [Alphaproteobacteria bacterium]MDP6588271.1 DUF2336 domain-containing protein [Alphaproteobacteria bacterium]MDP6817699.1 DUF2336 domain-containing protein [Alphaproteobacteria bacterium]
MPSRNAAKIFNIEDISLEELFVLARDKSSAGRQTLFENMRDMFLDGGGSVSDREKAQMGEILRQLVHDVEKKLRKSLAEKLAQRSDTPHALIVELANDEFEVAHPILLESNVLQDADLIETVKHRTMEHQLAISMRKNVSEDVSEALVETGQEDVIASLLNNHGAKISRHVMDYLVSESKRVDSYQNPLVQRPDLPPELAERMSWWVSAALREHISDKFSLDLGDLDDVIETVAEEQFGVNQDDLPPVSKADNLVERLSDLGELDASFLIKALRQGEISLFESAFCKLTGLKLKLMRRILFEPGGEALVILCRAVDVGADTFSELFELSRRAKDREEEIGGQQMERLHTLYSKTKQEDAKRILKRWRRSSDYLFAVKQISGST